MKVNVLIIGNGHYATGTTVLSGKKETDKDFGVVLPAMLEMQSQGLIDKIFLASRDGSKLPSLKKKLQLMHERFGWGAEITFFPKENQIDDYTFVRAVKVLPDPGLVVIATPDYWHKEMMMESAKAGKHFVVMKPAVVKTRDLEEVIELTKEKNILGVVDYHKVFDDANLIIRDNYRQGVYGDIVHIFTRQTQRRDMLEIFKNWAGKNGHNVNHYLGSHYIHLVGFITGAIPINVRAMGQYGIAKREYHIDTPDIIGTQILWRAKNKTEFISYHLAGWSDPSETSAMTYQEIHLIGTKGQADSDQRFRGSEMTVCGDGHKIFNPYFFHLHHDLNGKLNMDSQYGFKSLRTFVLAVAAIAQGTRPAGFSHLPTIEDSRTVTVILEAADRSLAFGSKIIPIARQQCRRR